MIPTISDPYSMAMIAFALFLGGILKGAIGMGSPVIAIPVLASFFDVRLAVALMVLPNLFTNVWQLWAFREGQMRGSLPWLFAGGGALGAAIGTVLLVQVPSDTLKILVGCAVVFYVSLRLWNAELSIPTSIANRIALPIGAAAGILQGAAGISAPISVSFLNAMKLDRKVFIPTISAFFVAMSLVQIPMQWQLGLINSEIILLGSAALLPLMVGIPLGAVVVRSFSPQSFDRLVLIVLVGLAIKLFFDAFI